MSGLRVGPRSLYDRWCDDALTAAAVETMREASDDLREQIAEAVRRARNCNRAILRALRLMARTAGEAGRQDYYTSAVLWRARRSAWVQAARRLRAAKVEAQAAQLASWGVRP